jgi:hypothetical protein
MSKRESRPQQWARLVAEAQAAAEKLEAAKTELADILSRFEELKGTYENWYESYPENLQGDETYAKLTAINELDFNEDSDVDAMLECVTNAADIELPRGFGRD